MRRGQSIAVAVVEGDALEYASDCLVLKHARGLYGVDAAAYKRLCAALPCVALPETGKHTLLDSNRAVSAQRVLFVGVESLSEFDYAQIRDFGRRAMSILAHGAGAVAHVALTIHGANFGLDEIEAFKSELAGIIEAIATGDFPLTLARISFVERDPRRAMRLSAALQALVPNGILETSGRGPLDSVAVESQSDLRTVGYSSHAKPSVFVAMPFTPAMNDLFHYGIEGALKPLDLVVERADLASFVGDVMEWVKARVSTAKLVVADLSTANPNVYLEVGYAWGRGVPTILVVRKNEEMKFDIRGQRCLEYESIQELESKLAREATTILSGSAEPRTPDANARARTW